MAQHRYEATLLRAVIGYLVGLAFVAAVEPVGIIVTRRFGDADVSGHPAELISIAMIWFWGTFQYLLLSPVLAAVPVWFLSHISGRRSWMVAAMAGAVMVFLWVFGHSAWRALYGAGPWENVAGDETAIRPVLALSDWLALWAWAAVYAAVGDIATLIIWRIAYRRVPVS
jgi:hypothetical protein